MRILILGLIVLLTNDWVLAKDTPIPDCPDPISGSLPEEKAKIEKLNENVGSVSRVSVVLDDKAKAKNLTEAILREFAKRDKVPTQDQKLKIEKYALEKMVPRIPIMQNSMKGQFISTQPNKKDIGDIAEYIPDQIRLLATGEAILEWPKEVLGKGGFKTHYLGVDFDQAVNGLAHSGVALSQFSVKADGAPRARREFIVQKDMGDKYGTAKLRRLHEAASQHSVMFYSVQDLYDGNVANFMEAKESKRKLPLELTQSEKLEIEIQVADQLAGAHKENILHRDLKPENIFLNKDAPGKVTAHLGDWGIADDFRGVDTSREEFVEYLKDSIKGTPGYIAPDHSSKESNRVPKTVDELKKVESWSLGLFYHYLETGTKKEGCSENEDVATNLFRRIRHITTYDALCKYCELFCDGNSTEKDKEPVANSREHVIYELLNPDPKKRITPAQAREELIRLRKPAGRE